MNRTRIAVWLPLLFVPLAAWSKDTTVVAVILASLVMLAAGARPVLPWPALALAAWTAAAMFWAPQIAWANWMQSWMVIGAGAVLVGGCLLLPAATLRMVPTAVVASVGGLFAILLIERVSGAGVIGLVRTTDTMDRLFNVLSAGLALLCCMTYPAVALIARRFQTTAAALFLAAVFLVAASYHMDAAPAALAAGAVVYCIVYFGGQRALFVIVATAAVVALGWGAIAEAALLRGGDRWLTEHVDINWGLRLQIWTRVGDLIGVHPFFGHGFEAGRMLGRPDAAGTEVPVPFMHPHNGMLQVWLELGLVGTALLLTWGAVALRDLTTRFTSQAALATTGATLATTSVFWLVSFGLWAGWWLAALALAAAALVIALRSDVSPVVTHPGLEHQDAP